MRHMRGMRSAQVQGYVWTLYAIVIVWVLLGRPDLRIRILAITRKTLRRVAVGAASAAERTEDALLDLATSKNA